MPHLRIATRPSRMAQTQARLVGDALVRAHAGLTYELVLVQSSGDKSQAWNGNLHQDGGKGAFIKEVEQAVLAHQADIAVHSMKDVPTDVEHPELMIAAVLPRDDRRDVAICKVGQAFEALPAGAKVGTSSVRRQAQLRRYFPHLEPVHFRGNADTRLEKLDRGEVDCILLAKSGVDRLGLMGRITVVFEPDIVMPACQQGVVGIQCLTSATAVQELVAAINHAPTMTCLQAERALLKLLQGNCFSPIAGYCEITKGNNLRMQALVASLNGQQLVRSRLKHEGQQPEALARAVADDLLAQGAAALIAAAAPLDEAG